MSSFAFISWTCPSWLHCCTSVLQPCMWCEQRRFRLPASACLLTPASPCRPCVPALGCSPTCHPSPPASSCPSSGAEGIEGPLSFCLQSNLSPRSAISPPVSPPQWLPPRSCLVAQRPPALLWARVGGRPRRATQPPLGPTPQGVLSPFLSGLRPTRSRCSPATCPWDPVGPVSPPGLPGRLGCGPTCPGAPCLCFPQVQTLKMSPGDCPLCPGWVTRALSLGWGMGCTDSLLARPAILETPGWTQAQGSSEPALPSGGCVHPASPPSPAGLQGRPLVGGFLPEGSWVSGPPPAVQALPSGPTRGGSRVLCSSLSLSWGLHPPCSQLLGKWDPREERVPVLKRGQLSCPRALLLALLAWAPTVSWWPAHALQTGPQALQPCPPYRSRQIPGAEAKRQRRSGRGPGVSPRAQAGA